MRTVENVSDNVKAMTNVKIYYSLVFIEKINLYDMFVSLDKPLGTYNTS